MGTAIKSLFSTVATDGVGIPENESLWKDKSQNLITNFRSVGVIRNDGSGKRGLEIMRGRNLPLVPLVASDLGK